MQETEKTKKTFFSAKVFKYLGAAGFLFFFIKGMLWLVLLALAAYFAW